MSHTYEKPRLEQVRGDTWCIVTGYVRIPMYRLGGGRIVLIDSGIAVPDGAEIASLLHRENLTVAAILTSHAHIDHTGNHRMLQQEFGAKIWMSLFDAAASWNVMGMKALFGNTSYRGTEEYAESMFCQADEIIRPGDTAVTVEGATFPILRLPGHAPEHLGFVTPDGVAYLGDTLMSEQVLSAVRIPYCTCCELDLQSKRRVAELPYDCYIIPHNGVRSDVRALAQANIDSLLEKVELTAAQADCWRSMEELVARAAAAMGMEGNNVYRIKVAERNIRTFAEHLLDTGRLIQRGKDGIVQYIRTDCM